MKQHRVLSAFPFCWRYSCDLASSCQVFALICPDSVLRFIILYFAFSINLPTLTRIVIFPCCPSLCSVHQAKIRGIVIRVAKSVQLTEHDLRMTADMLIWCCVNFTVGDQLVRLLQGFLADDFPWTFMLRISTVLQFYILQCLCTIWI